MIRLLILLLALHLDAAEPVASAWIMSPGAGNAELRKSLPNVHEVVVQDKFVEVRSAGLSLLYLGPFQNPLTAGAGLRDLRFRIPRQPVLENGNGQRVGPGPLGVFLNGVPLYNQLAGYSYGGANLWHFDPVAYQDPAHPVTLGVLAQMIANGTAHSPLLGFAMDGFPIYGPWGYANADGSGGLRPMRSGYRLRAIQKRTTWPDGTVLTPGQYGPPVNAQYPLGTFAEDYEYRPGPGDLDSSNGRFCITPDYPQGTYAYFLTTDDGRPAFPYFLADRFRGRIPDAPARVHFAHSALAAGAPAELRFTFPNARSLEVVHERPLHLMVISSDLTLFEHIHPEWKVGDYYAVTHTFPRPGKYRLFAQYTLPGEPERTECFDVVAGGSGSLSPAPPPVPLEAKLHRPDRIRTGEDVPFSVAISGATVEPYLGAWAHFVLLDRSMTHFIHAHPEEAITAAGPHVHAVTGPPPGQVNFTANFAAPGHYKLWAQFQVAGKLAAIPFEMDVAPAPASPHDTAKIPPQAIRVSVDAQGFHPARIAAAPGRPLTLAVTRSETSNCATQIVFPALGIKRDLPLGQTTIVPLPPMSDDISFACGMGMYRGMIVGSQKQGTLLE